MFDLNSCVSAWIKAHAEQIYERLNDDECFITALSEWERQIMKKINCNETFDSVNRFCYWFFICFDQCAKYFSLLDKVSMVFFSELHSN